MTNPITPQRLAELCRHYDRGADDALEGLLELIATGQDGWLTKGRDGWRESLKAYQADHVALLAEVERLQGELDIPDESLSPTDPAELVPWLRALPVGAIVLDKLGDAWQVRQATAGHPYIRCVAGDKSGYLASDREAREMVEWAPYRLVWSGGAGQRGDA